PQRGAQPDRNRDQDQLLGPVPGGPPRIRFGQELFGVGPAQGLVGSDGGPPSRWCSSVPRSVVFVSSAAGSTACVPMLACQDCRELSGTSQVGDLRSSRWHIRTPSRTTRSATGSLPAGRR